MKTISNYLSNICFDCRDMYEKSGCFLDDEDLDGNTLFYFYIDRDLTCHKMTKRIFTKHDYSSCVVQRPPQSSKEESHDRPFKKLCFGWHQSDLLIFFLSHKCLK